MYSISWKEFMDYIRFSSCYLLFNMLLHFRGITSHMKLLGCTMQWIIKYVHFLCTFMKEEKCNCNYSFCSELWFSPLYNLYKSRDLAYGFNFWQHWSYKALWYYLWLNQHQCYGNDCTKVYISKVSTLPVP